MYSGRQGSFSEIILGPVNLVLQISEIYTHLFMWHWRLEQKGASGCIFICSLLSKEGLTSPDYYREGIGSGLSI